MPVQVVDDEERTFEGWGSIEQVDKEGDLIPMDVLKKLMPTYMERGGTVSDGHTNRHVAKIDEYNFAIDPDTQKEGVYLKGHVFKHYTADDAVWSKMKSGEYSGMSFGGRELLSKMECDAGECANVMKEGELWEWALVPRGMNQSANITAFNDKAKSDEEDDEEEVEKVLTEYITKLESQGREVLADDMVKRCGATKRKYVKMLDDMSPTQALSEVQKGLDELRDSMPNDKTKQEEEIPAGGIGEPEIDPLEAIMQQLSQISARLDALENPEPAEYPMGEEEVLASETGLPVHKEDEQEARTQAEGEEEATPPSPSEQEDKELNEGVTTDTIKSLVQKEVAKSLNKRGYVKPSGAGRHAHDGRPPLDKANAGIEQGEPMLAGTENWRDIAKMDNMELREHVREVTKDLPLRG